MPCQEPASLGLPMVMTGVAGDDFHPMDGSVIRATQMSRHAQAVIALCKAHAGIRLTLRPAWLVVLGRRQWCGECHGFGGRSGVIDSSRID